LNADKYSEKLKTNSYPRENSITVYYKEQSISGVEKLEKTPLLRYKTEPIGWF
jgi:hypothetical protein